jgi:hypothetical protein
MYKAILKQIFGNFCLKWKKPCPLAPTSPYNIFQKLLQNLLNVCMYLYFHYNFTVLSGSIIVKFSKIKTFVYYFQFSFKASLLFKIHFFFQFTSIWIKENVQRCSSKTLNFKFIHLFGIRFHCLVTGSLVSKIMNSDGSIGYV